MVKCVLFAFSAAMNVDVGHNDKGTEVVGDVREKTVWDGMTRSDVDGSECDTKMLIIEGDNEMFR